MHICPEALYILSNSISQLSRSLIDYFVADVVLFSYSAAECLFFTFYVYTDVDDSVMGGGGGLYIADGEK